MRFSSSVSVSFFLFLYFSHTEAISGCLYLLFTQKTCIMMLLSRFITRESKASVDLSHLGSVTTFIPCLLYLGGFLGMIPGHSLFRGCFSFIMQHGSLYVFEDRLGLALG